MLPYVMSSGIRLPEQAGEGAGALKHYGEICFCALYVL